MSEIGYTPLPLGQRLAEAARVRGARPVAGEFLRWGARLAAGLPRTVAGDGGQFVLDGEPYPYLYERYKRTWQTERAVEVPVVQRVVDRMSGARVLEVGNVLSHYRPQRHPVVDKYERAPGVLNRDIFELSDLGPFDLVVAVSTVEHVGWDEAPRVRGRAVEAIQALRALLAPAGRLLLTVPVGYNSSLDEALKRGEVPFDHLAALRRQGGGTEWRQVTPEEAWRAPYDFLLYSARGVLVGTIGGEATGGGGG
jgi:SAM-dependent methyltransferase